MTAVGHLVQQLKPRIFDFLSRVARTTSGRDRGRFPDVRLAKVGKRHFLVRCEYFTPPFSGNLPRPKIATEGPVHNWRNGWVSVISSTNPFFVTLGGEQYVVGMVQNCNRRAGSRMAVRFLLLLRQTLFSLLSGPRSCHQKR